MPTANFWSKDGQYSYIVLVTIVLSHFSCTGFAFGSAGVLADVYPKVFKEDQAKTNVIGSSLVGVYFLAVPINTIIMRVIGVRVIALIGSVLAILGMILSAHATEVWQLVMSYSVVTGLGMCMNMVSTIGVVPHYFSKRKDAAYACTGLGSGLATLVYPVILSKMLSSFSYKETMYYISPLVLLSMLAPVVFIPQLEQQRPESAVKLVMSYLKCFRRFVTPFYLLNAFFCRGAQVALMVLLFSTISQSTDISTAVTSATILGVTFLSGTLLLTLFLLKFKLNQLVLQLVCNVTVSIVCFVMGFFNQAHVFYLCSGLFGICHGITIAIKGSLSAHLYTAKEVEYSFGKAEGISSVASFLFPFTAGYIQKYTSYSCGLHYLGGLSLLGALFLVLAIVIRPSMLTSKSKENEDVGEKFCEEMARQRDTVGHDKISEANYVIQYI